MRYSKKLFYTGVCFAVFFALVYLVLIDYISIPWRDEIAWTDAPAHVALSGKWQSHVNQYVYNPLHGFILIGWISILGISHFTVCSLSVLLAFISYIVLLNILLRREIITGIVTVAIFSLLYWGGYGFSVLITQGRIDLLALLFTILLVNEIIPSKDNILSENKWKFAIYAFLLVGTSIYPVPAFCFFCIGMYIANRDKEFRKQLRSRYIYIIVGFISSFLLICLFYLYEHHFFRFINTYISFNATINHDAQTNSFIERLFNAYLLDIYSVTVLIVSSFILVANKNLKDKSHFKWIVWILAIPFLMVIAGRYRPYYSWIFYIPVIVLASYAVDNLKKNLKTFALIAVVASIMIRPVLKYHDFENKRNQLNNAINFVEQCSAYLNKGNNVVFNNSMFYYSLVDRRYVPWQKYKGLQEIPQPEEKFKAFIEKKFKDKEKRQQLLSIFNKMEHSDPYLPESGFFITEGNDEYKNTVDFLQNHKYNVGKFYEYNGFTLLKFNINMQ